MVVVTAFPCVIYDGNTISPFINVITVFCPFIYISILSFFHQFPTPLSYIDQLLCVIVNAKYISPSTTFPFKSTLVFSLLADIAKSCYLTTEGFIRKFKRHVVETPYSYLKKLKLRTAQNMRQAGVNLKEIAEKCGYSDSFSLLHSIKQKTTPKSFNPQ